MKLTFIAVVPASFVVSLGACVAAASVAFQTLTFATLLVLWNPFV